jgi:hypothetical protein
MASWLPLRQDDHDPRRSDRLTWLGDVENDARTPLRPAGDHVLRVWAVGTASYKFATTGPTYSQ